MQLGMTKLTDHAPASQEHCWRLGLAIKEQMVSTMDSLLEETKNIESNLPAAHKLRESTERAFGSKVTLAPSGGVPEVVEKEKQP